MSSQDPGISTVESARLQAPPHPHPDGDGEDEGKRFMIHPDLPNTIDGLMEPVPYPDGLAGKSAVSSVSSQDPGILTVETAQLQAPSHCHPDGNGDGDDKDEGKCFTMHLESPNTIDGLTELVPYLDGLTGSPDNITRREDSHVCVHDSTMHTAPDISTGDISTLSHGREGGIANPPISGPEHHVQQLHVNPAHHSPLPAPCRNKEDFQVSQCTKIQQGGRVGIHGTSTRCSTQPEAAADECRSVKVGDRHGIMRYAPGTVITWNVDPCGFGQGEIGLQRRATVIDAFIWAIDFIVALKWNGDPVLPITFSRVSDDQPSVCRLKFELIGRENLAHSFSPRDLQKQPQQALTVFYNAFLPKFRPHLHSILLHEIGHIVGLRHDFFEKGSPCVEIGPVDEYPFMGYPPNDDWGKSKFTKEATEGLFKFYRLPLGIYQGMQVTELVLDVNYYAKSPGLDPKSDSRLLGPDKRASKERISLRFQNTQLHYDCTTPVQNPQKFAARTPPLPTNTKGRRIRCHYTTTNEDNSSLIFHKAMAKPKRTTSPSLIDKHNVTQPRDETSTTPPPTNNSSTTYARSKVDQLEERVGVTEEGFVLLGMHLDGSCDSSN